MSRFGVVDTVIVRCGRSCVVVVGSHEGHFGWGELCAIVL